MFKRDQLGKGYEFGELRVGTYFTHGVISAKGAQGQKILETIRYMQNKSAQVQLNVLTKATDPKLKLCKKRLHDFRPAKSAVQNRFLLFLASYAILFL